ncbi:MAG: hypothetical protein ACK4SS_04215 [Cypionkella sp.]
MKKHRWLASALSAAKTEDIFLPWAMRRAAHVAPLPAPRIIPRAAPTAATAPPFAIAAR